MTDNVAAQLTPEAKEAIRAYLLKIMAPLLAVASIASAAIGFGINEVARSSAYASAYSEASDAMIRIATASSEAKTKADVMAETIANKSNEAVKAADRASAAAAKIAAISSDKFELLASQLLADPNFRQSLASVSDERLKSANAKAESIQNAWNKLLLDGTPATEGRGGGTLSDCPPGSYAVGLRLAVSAGGAHGIVYGGQITCRRFAP